MLRSISCCVWALYSVVLVRVFFLWLYQFVLIIVVFKVNSEIRKSESFLLCISLLRDFLVYSTPLRFHINYRFNLPLYEKCIFSMVKGLRLICIFAFYGINIFRILSSNPWMQDLLSYFYVFFNFWKQCFVVQCARLSPLWLLLFLLYFIFLDATLLDF